MRYWMRQIVLALFQFLREPSEQQIESELRKAFGLASDVTYRIVNNNITANGDTVDAGRFTIDEKGRLHVTGTDSSFVIKNNVLYKVE